MLLFRNSKAFTLAVLRQVQRFSNVRPEMLKADSQLTLDAGTQSIFLASRTIDGNIFWLCFQKLRMSLSFSIVGLCFKYCSSSSSPLSSSASSISAHRLKSGTGGGGTGPAISLSFSCVCWAFTSVEAFLGKLANSLCAPWYISSLSSVVNIWSCLNFGQSRTASFSCCPKTVQPKVSCT